MKYYTYSKHDVPHGWQTDAISQRQAEALRHLSVRNLTVQCMMEPASRDDTQPAASVRSNCPVPTDVVIYYYEVHIVNKGLEGKIAVGFSADGTEIFDKLPGWTAQSYGYHGDDGHTFTGGGARGTQYGPTYSTGDTIGALLNRADRTISFYKNGIFLGVAFRDVAQHRLYPTLGCCTLGEEVEANFGAQPFKVDVEALQRQYLAGLLGTICTTPLPTSSKRPSATPPSAPTTAARRGTLLPQMVFDYLVQHRCCRTAEIIARDLLTPPPIPSTSSTPAAAPIKAGPNPSTSSATIPPGPSKPPPPAWDPAIATDIEARARIYGAVELGDIDGALAMVAAQYGERGSDTDPLRADPRLAFRLKVQKFIQMMPTSPEAALEYGRGQLATTGHDALGKEEEDLLTDALSLLAYEHPEASPCGQLLGAGHRRALAEELNSALLRAAGRPAHCGLERAYQQAVVAVGELRGVGHAASYLLDVRQVCLQGAGPTPARPLPELAAQASEKLPGSPLVRQLEHLEQDNMAAIRAMLHRV